MSQKVVLVTGGSRGLGREIALSFAKKGAQVGINFFKSKEKALSIQNEIHSFGGTSLLLEADVSDSSQVKEMIGKIVEKWGRIDTLVNNAGITRDRTILKMSDSEWLEAISVNLTGAFWCLRECARVMAKQKEGAILNIASILGLKGSFGNSNYVASKAGLIGLTKSAARELGRFHIRVHAVLPGFHPTDMGLTVWEKERERVQSEHTLGQLTDIQELVEFIHFLSEKKSISGQIYNFDSRIL